MSGVVGASRIKSRKDYKEVLKEYTNVLEGFKGFISLNPSGSYNSDLSKGSFGDMDLVLHISPSYYGLNKKNIKLALIEYLTSLDKDIIKEFTSIKHKGKRYYNSGEIVTINYKSSNPNIKSIQVDNIISTSKEEMDFKIKFLDMPAEKQGLVLGLIKVFSIEKDINKLSLVKDFKLMGLILKKSEELEFNISSSSLQLRKVQYKEDSFKQIKKEVIWSSTNFNYVIELLEVLGFNFNDNFDELIKDIPNLNNPRSLNRIKGLFKSMISVKSGEVNTPKGLNKLKHLDIIENLK